MPSAFRHQKHAIHKKVVSVLDQLPTGFFEALQHKKRRAQALLEIAYIYNLSALITHVAHLL